MSNRRLMMFMFAVKEFQFLSTRMIIPAGGILLVTLPFRMQFPVQTQDDIVINVSEGEYNEAPTLNQSRTVTIKGGWNSAFSSQTANKTFIKAPIATQGAIKAEMLTVVP